MGEVMNTLKVMPENPDVDLEQLKAAIADLVKEPASLHAIEEEPIAFGLVALNTMVIVEDGEGGTDAIEAAIAEVEAAIAELKADGTFDAIIEKYISSK